MGAAVEFCVLGPLEVRDQGMIVDLGPPRVRATCGILLVRPGNLVTIDQFVDELWPEQPPPDARALVRGYVSRLRRALGSNADRVVTRKPGYLLLVEGQELDLHRFERLVADARSADDPRRAVELFRQALGLWRGEPFADVPRTASIAAATTRLTEQRLTTREECFDAALAAGQHADVVTELTEFVRANPLRERAAGQLMLAMYRCGRQAEALEQYQRTRRALAEQAGVDPGAELRQLHQRILTADPTLSPPAATPARTPRQLPRDLPTFVGRERELGVLADLLDAGAGPVIVLHGAPGVGKSALAVHAAHFSAAWFPDGQLHVNLRGATPAVRPLSAAEALHQLLRSLGVAGTDIPAGIDEAAALLRTVVAGQRLLLVLDNAATAAQVRPLLPGCAVLITSRTRLAALEGITHLRVGPLTPDAAYAMLDGLISDVRPAAEPDATYRLAELCGHLPLGLHVAAARLNARSSWAVRDLVDRLTDERNRLTELAAGDVALRSSLAVSHTALHDSDNPTDQRAARALCLFGLLPVTDIDLDLAAAVLGTSPAEADRIMERLLDAHLVEETVPGRFHLHDLTRLFAHELGAGTVPPDERCVAISRLLGHYLATTCLANTLAYPHRAHHPVPEVSTPPKRLDRHEEALRWLDAQCHNMIAVIQQAWHGPVEHARLGVGLALALHWYLHSGGNDLTDTIGFHEDVVRAAERLGDRRSQAYAHGNLAVNLRHIGRLDEACAHTSAELGICREIGDRFGEQRALGNLGHTLLAVQRPEEAIGYLEQQLALARDIDAPLGQAFALVNLGKAHHQLGRSDEAVRMIETGLAWYEKTGDEYRQCDVHEVLARIHIDLGRHDEAIALMTRGLEHARRIDYRFGEIWALTTLAQAHRLSGEMDKALCYAERAVAASDNLHGTQARSDALAEYARLS
jgi:DNA-binding SARP family transcriptional activator/tetratricopeptide (TPR) repeat protein